MPVAYAFAVTVTGTTLPTPLYPVYRETMGLSWFVVTVIFAAYAAGVIAALVLAGLASSAASAVVFLVGGGLPSLVALLIGRVLSGLSAGIFTGTATVAVGGVRPGPIR